MKNEGKQIHFHAQNVNEIVCRTHDRPLVFVVGPLVHLACKGIVCLGVAMLSGVCVCALLLSRDGSMLVIMVCALWLMTSALPYLGMPAPACYIAARWQSGDGLVCARKPILSFEFIQVGLASHPPHTLPLRVKGRLGVHFDLESIGGLAGPCLLLVFKNPTCNPLGPIVACL